jgi:monoamine oxidase
MQADVIVIGAGAAGLLAARNLSQKGKMVTLLEARNRIGGRIHTINDDAFVQPLEGGAEFIHGQLPLTLQLLKEAGIKTIASGGSFWHSYDGKLKQEEEFIADEDVLISKLNSLQIDTSVANFIDTHFSAPEHKALRQSLTSYVEGYYAGDVKKASALALKEEWESGEDDDQRIAGGYGQLVQYLYKQCVQNNCRFYLNTTVNAIHWQRGNVLVTAADGTPFGAAKAIITVPVGILQATHLPSSILFNPAIDDTLTAVQKLGFGSVIKIVLQTNAPFWQTEFNLKDMAFLFSEQSIPTWWTQHPQQTNLLTGWCAGPAAESLKHVSNDELFEKAVTSLDNIFSTSTDVIKEKIGAWHVFNWAADTFTCGGYSYTTVEGKNAVEALAQPVEDTLYFAGEGMHIGNEIGTVEAAFISAQKVAQQIMDNV